MALKHQDSVSIEARRVKDFLNNEIKEHAQYVIRTRAMPNIMDGLRIGARKILWAALTGDLSKKTKPVKMPSLIGDSMKLHYNHGDSSLMNTIIQLGSKHVYQYTPFEFIGQIGSLHNPKCTTAPRYLHIRNTEYINFFKTDFELLELEIEDGDKVEPKYFLPIIPIVLLWRTNSPGFGFSFRAFSYDINSVIDNCILSITNGSCSTNIDQIQLIPHIAGYNGENFIWNGNKNSWYSVAKYEMDIANDTLFITDLPYNVTYDAFEKNGAELLENGFITGFDNFSLDGNIRYRFKFSHGRLNLLYQDKWKFFTKLKMFSKIPKDTLNLIDEDGKTMLFFDNPHDLIDSFVKRRLNYYVKRKVKTIKVLEENIAELQNKITFIDLVTSDKIIINKRAISLIKQDLDKHKLPYYVLKMNIEKLTIDEIKSMNDEIQGLKNKLEYIRKTSIQEMYVNDLVELKKKISSINRISA